MSTIRERARQQAIEYLKRHEAEDKAAVDGECIPCFLIRRLLETSPADLTGDCGIGLKACRLESVQERTLIETSCLIGDGTPRDPFRVAYYYHTREGAFIAARDTLEER